MACGDTSHTEEIHDMVFALLHNLLNLLQTLLG